MDDKEKAAAALAGIILLPLYVLYDGYIVHLLWGWFIVTTFSIKAISVLEAVGVCLVVSALRYKSKKSDDEDIVEKRLRGFMELSFMLGFGWVVKNFM
jgi:hypothetical protein